MLRIDPEATQNVVAETSDVAELRHLRPIPFLYQSGYLMIRGYVNGLYTLGVPDEEVRQDFCTLMTAVAGNQDAYWAAERKGYLLGGQWDYVLETLQSPYATMAYGPTERRVHENLYGQCLSFLLASCRFDFTMEHVQSDGRADVVAKHPAEVCIFELKVDELVDKAFVQIREKGYPETFKTNNCPVWLIGLSFDSKSL